MICCSRSNSYCRFKTIVLFIIFVETKIHVSSNSLKSKQQHLFELEAFCNIINVFKSYFYSARLTVPLKKILLTPNSSRIFIFGWTTLLSWLYILSNPLYRWKLSDWKVPLNCFRISVWITNGSLLVMCLQ